MVLSAAVTHHTHSVLALILSRNENSGHGTPLPLFFSLGKTSQSSTSLSLSFWQKVTLYPGARLDFHVFLKSQTLIYFFNQSHSQICDLFCNSSSFPLSGGCATKLKNNVFQAVGKKMSKSSVCLTSGNYPVNYVYLINKVTKMCPSLPMISKTSVYTTVRNEWRLQTTMTLKVPKIPPPPFFFKYYINILFYLY